MGRTLFLVESPFQCLCMMEAIQHFKISDYDVLIPYGDEYSNEMMFRLLDKRGISYEARSISHIIYDVVPFIFTKKKYKTIFSGNYLAPKSYPLAVAMAGYNSTINYLDDGTQALEIFSENPKPRYKKLSIKLVVLLYRTFAFAKRTHENVFFTIYDVKSEKLIIEKNSFSIFSKIKKSELEGVYIIGTNSSILKFIDNSYLDYLRAILSRIRGLYPSEKIFYCPHRRDANNKYYEAILKDEMGVEIFKTEVSVEYDFLLKGIAPKYVVGFLSNALFTLKKISPHSIVETISFRLDDDNQNRENLIIEKGLNRSGIESIFLF